MIDSTRLGDVVDECAARSSELVVEDDAGGEAEEALEDAFSDSGQGAGAVAFEGEEVFAGPEDRLDALADRREMEPSSGFVFAARPHDRGVQFADFEREVAAGVALVAQQRFTADAGVRASSSRPTSRSSRLGEVSVSALGCRPARRSRCNRKPQK